MKNKAFTIVVASVVLIAVTAIVLFSIFSADTAKKRESDIFLESKDTPKITVKDTKSTPTAIDLTPDTYIETEETTVAATTADDTRKETTEKEINNTPETTNAPKKQKEEPKPKETTGNPPLKKDPAPVQTQPKETVAKEETTKAPEKAEMTTKAEATSPPPTDTETTRVETEAETTETQAQTTEIGEPKTPTSPNFTVYDRNGNKVELHDFVGKPIVLNFWATWCGPCKHEMPAFNSKYLEFGDEVQFLMVNLTDGTRDTVESVNEFMAENGYSFPVFYDTDFSAVNAYAISSIPTTYFIDSEGTLVAYAKGAIDSETLQEGIDMIT